MIFSAVSKRYPLLGRGSTYYPTQNLTPTGIATAEGFGTNQLNLIIYPVGTDSTEGFGNTGVGTSLVLHAAIFLRPATRHYPFFARLSGGGIFPQTIVTDGIGSVEVFGTAFVQLPTQSVIVSGIDSGEGFGATTVAPGVVLLLPTGVGGGEIFGTAQLNQLTGGLGAIMFRPHTEMTPFLPRPLKNPPATGPQFLIATSILSSGAFGNLSVNCSVTILPTPTGTGEGFGSAKLVLYIRPTSALTSEGLGTPEVVVGPVSIIPTPIGGQESFGDLTILGGVLQNLYNYLIKRRRNI